MLARSESWIPSLALQGEKEILSKAMKEAKGLDRKVPRGQTLQVKGPTGAKS